MQPIIEIAGLTKTYASGLVALRGIDLDVRRGEILALLGPNGAGKTTLISIVCGIVRRTAGSVRIDGHDIEAEARAARRLVGLVPQELTTDAFETVADTVAFSRGLFGRPPDPALVERVLRQLSLWDRRASRLMTLSGGMKRRVMIAKALSHEPRVLFLDEPTAGVDVELRREMWEVVRALKAEGVTIILTTHYIEEAEELADRVGVINKGRLIVVEETAALMRKLGKKRISILLASPLAALPDQLAGHGLALMDEGQRLSVTYDATGDNGGGIGAVLRHLGEAGIAIRDIETAESSLEEIFVDLVREGT